MRERVFPITLKIGFIIECFGDEKSKKKCNLIPPITIMHRRVLYYTSPNSKKDWNSD